MDQIEKQLKGTNENFPSQFLWRHGGHVGGHENSSRKSSIVLTPNMAALSRCCKPRIIPFGGGFHCVLMFFFFKFRGTAFLIIM